ncbi:hypothetical protein [Gordonia sp. CPCC 205333]|uniref:hypothetical protein n=1 Tax=Gordonia sp. CPCC 205333 TaxID=3140790 RepID=UPI003AF3D305
MAAIAALAAPTAMPLSIFRRDIPWRAVAAGPADRSLNFYTSFVLLQLSCRRLELQYGMKSFLARPIALPA